MVILKLGKKKKQLKSGSRFGSRADVAMKGTKPKELEL